MRKALTYIFIFLVVVASAQTVQLSGIIQDERSGAALSGVILSTAAGKATTDARGVFTIAMQPRSTQKITFSHLGYKSMSRNVMLEKDSVLVCFMTPSYVDLDEVTVSAGKDNSFGISRLNNVEGTTIYAGKKSEAVYLQDLNANLAANNSRQIFSKIPGINIFENDGSGSTIGIGGRGLNPNRISNFNTRQNGYDISADALGYPESYYTPPTEAIERIEILRGAAGLQFGTQFGGMINYKFSEAPLNRKMKGNFRQTAGSYGFFNSFNQVSGTVNKYSYNTFYNFRHYDGWRDRSQLNSHNVFGSLRYQVNEKLSVTGEYTFLNYISQQPGGLTDKQFETDPGMVTRFRNWFRVNWNLLSVSADLKATDQTRFTLTTFGLDAGRDALGFLGRADRPDDTSAVRNLLSDKYRNHGAELRMLHRYTLAGNNSHLLVGARYYRGHTSRLQGDADKGASARFEFLHPGEPENSAYEFPSRNYALFAENIFQLGKRFSLTPGLRYEYISTAAEGYYNLINTIDTKFNQTIYDYRRNTRDFILAGLGAQFKISPALEAYANFSQNYRSINFNDMRVMNANFQVDPDLRDESGFTFDGGFRGAVKNVLYFDAGFFLLKYNDRIGTALRVDEATYQIYRYRTNIGSSRNAGLETFAEVDWLKLADAKSKHKLSTFVNFSYIRAIYTSTVPAFKGKKVEFVPGVIFRTGLTYGFGKFGFTAQYSYTGSQFSDASNALYSPSALYGLIPAYSVLDLSAHYSWRYLGLMAGINNATNTKYFTRRAEGYPGPGILPADPVNAYVTLRLKI